MVFQLHQPTPSGSRGAKYTGDSVKAVIINVDRKNRGINLSIKAMDKADETAAMKKLSAEDTSSAGTTNLGALLKAKMASSKVDA